MTRIRELAQLVRDSTQQVQPGGPSVTRTPAPGGLDVVEVNLFSDSDLLQPDLRDDLVDVVFFQVAFPPGAREATGHRLVELVKASATGEYDVLTIDELRQNPPSYIRLGGWIGDQGVALCFMALCAHARIGRILTIRDLAAEAMVQGEGIGFHRAYAAVDASGQITPDLVREKAGLGMLYLQLNGDDPPEEPAPDPWGLFRPEPEATG